MSWFGDIANSVKGVFGGNLRDNKGGQQQVSALSTGLNGAANQFVNQTNGLNGYSQQIAGHNYYNGAQQALERQNENYQQQNNAASMLYNQATGTAPSAADMQMQQGLANANNQAQSAMLSQQGGISPGLSQRNMLNAQAMQNAQIVGQGAAMRAQETAAGQQAYSGALGNMANTANAMYGNQFGLGQAQYGQDVNNLGYLTNTAQNQQAVRSGAAQNIFNGAQGNLNAQYQSQQAATAALGNTISAFAGWGASKSGGGK